MPESASLKFADIVLGQEAQCSVLLTQELVDNFVGLTGDYNPLHTDEAYAGGTAFGGTIVHGMLVSSFFSRLVGMHLPGRHALYLSQKLNFRKPCRIGMHLIVRGVVTQKSEFARTITLKTEVLERESKECLIDGEAVVRLLA